jgi:hypothetical protein
MIDSDLSQQYIGGLLAEIAKLKSRIDYLEKNPPKRKQKLARFQRIDKKQRCDSYYAEGGLWYHRKVEYKSKTKSALLAYHKKYPDAPIGPEGAKAGAKPKA